MGTESPLVGYLDVEILWAGEWFLLQAACARACVAKMGFYQVNGGSVSLEPGCCFSRKMQNHKYHNI